MKVPLLEYLDKLEATAKAAPTSYVLHAAEECAPATRAHIEATQPKATLALIAKLREAVDLLHGADDAAIKSGRGRDLMQIEVPS